MTVTPIPLRPLCFHVQSRRDPNTFYFVDWTAEPPMCTCNDFFKQGKRKAEAAGEPYLCHHLKLAKDSGWANYVETVKEIQLST